MDEIVDETATSSNMARLRRRCPRGIQFISDVPAGIGRCLPSWPAAPAQDGRTIVMEHEWSNLHGPSQAVLGFARLEDT